jgi:hypothetical protein
MNCEIEAQAKHQMLSLLAATRLDFGTRGVQAALPSPGNRQASRCQNALEPALLAIRSP